MSRWPARRPLVSPQIHEALRLLDSDDALVSDFLHGLRQHAANRLIPVAETVAT